MVNKTSNKEIKFHPLLAEKIASFISKSTSPVSYLELCEQFRLNDKAAQLELNACLDELDKQGRVVLGKSGNYGTAEQIGLLTGKVIGHREGFGFLALSSKGKDLFLPNHQMIGLLHGDFILAKEGGVDRKGRKEAKVVRVLRSREDAIVGRYFIEHGMAFVVPDDTRIQHEFIIEPQNSKGARHGQMVVAELVKRPSKRFSAIGKIIEVLGDHMAPGMEIDVALRNFDIPHTWPKKIDKELKRFGEDVPENAKLDRVDLRDLPLVTIDGEDARDFDDAVYCEPKKSGGWRLWVAIADVSYYVQPETELDNQAIERGTSVYFPEHVVPMLPEALSNGLCSLNPQVDRLCMVCEMTISAAGNLSGYQFYPAVMNSHARLTYTKVGKILDGDDVLREQYAEQVPHLEHLHAMYKALKVQRANRGAIEFETPEPRFIFNAERKIEAIDLVERNDAHKLIEESMILANVSAARFIEKHKAHALFRIHEPPEGEKLTNFISFLAELGLTGQFSSTDVEPKQYKALVDHIDGRPDQELIQTMMLRSMRQAVYSGDNMGHFGLALKGYAHFTSPIRRYPDLVLHRAIKAVLVKLKDENTPRNIGEFAYSEEQIAQYAEQTSMTERRADEATRDVANWLKCEYMRDHVGCTYAGVIAAVTGFGFFVRINDLYIEGLVHIGSLKNDYFVFDNSKQRLIGERTRTVYKLGDEVIINVLSVNLDEKKIDFELAAKDAELDTVASRSMARPDKVSDTKRKPKGVSKTQQLMQQEGRVKGKSNSGKPKQGKRKRPGKLEAPLKANNKPRSAGKGKNAELDEPKQHKTSKRKPSSKARKKASVGKKKTSKRR